MPRRESKDNVCMWCSCCAYMKKRTIISLCNCLCAYGLGSLGMGVGVYAVYIVRWWWKILWDSVWLHALWVNIILTNVWSACDCVHMLCTRALYHYGTRRAFAMPRYHFRTFFDRWTFLCTYHDFCMTFYSMVNLTLIVIDIQEYANSRRGWMTKMWREGIKKDMVDRPCTRHRTLWEIHLHSPTWAPYKVYMSGCM